MYYQNSSVGGSTHSNGSTTIVTSAVVKDIVQQALVQLTLNFSSVYVKNENGKILASKDMIPFLNSLSDCLSFIARDDAIIFSSDSYPIASKLLLDNNDYESLRLLLNRTLYTSVINSTRLYDFTLKNLCRITAPPEANDCAIDLISDVFASGFKDNAKQMVFEAINRMNSASLTLRQTLENSGQTQKQVSSSFSSSNKRKKKQMLKQKQLDHGHVPLIVKGGNLSSDSGITVPVSVARIISMFVRTRKILGAEYFPNVYRMVLSLVKDYDVDLVMGIYTQSLIDNVSSDTFKEIVVSSLGKKLGFNMAMQVLEEMRIKIGSGDYTLAENFASMDVDGTTNDENDSVDDDEYTGAMISLINAMVALY